MARFCTRLPSRKYFLPVTANGNYNISGHYLVQRRYEKLSVKSRENSRSPRLPGLYAFVKHLGEANDRMLWQAVKNLCATLDDIRVLRTIR